ncbi:MAG: histidine phosphatase family protein [Actinobacteria bacterium]|nr:histidine phosphatase family protein [Actinomycetota bacterium]
MRTRLVVVRHAEPDESVRHCIYGRLDPELSPEGAAHAEAIAAMLAGETFVALYTSPLRRARATAEPLARRTRLEPVVVDDLRELDFGELEGLTLEEAATRYPVEATWFLSPATATFPGGESVAALRTRVAAAIAAIVERHEGEQVAVVTHAMPIRTILVDALGMEPDLMFRFDLSYGSLTVVEWFEEKPFVRVVNAPRI